MKLRKDQKRLLKLQAINTFVFIVLYPLAMLLAGKPMTWGQFFLFAGIAVVVFGLVGFLYVLGSQVSEKKDK